MIDTRGVGQELQEQLVGAARKGKEQARKAQEQARKAQQQVHKGQEAVAEIVKSLTATAGAIRPQLPAVKLPKADSVRAGAETVRTNAQEIAEQMLAAQRKLTDQVAQVAAPLIAQGAERFGHAASTVRSAVPSLMPSRFSTPGSETAPAPTIVSQPAPEPATPETTAPETTAPAATPEAAAPAAAADTAATSGRTGPRARQTTPRKTASSGSKASTGKAASEGKSSPAKRGTGKTSTGKNSAAKNSTASNTNGKTGTDGK